MKVFRKIAWLAAPALMLAGLSCSPARAQAPVVVAPVVVDTAAPIIVQVLKPKPKPTGLAKFEGYVLHANIAQITARDKTNELSIQTFSLSQEASEKMQQIVDKGGYQWGDKVTVYYDPKTMKATKFKGKASKPI
jgi:hypothetical protein